MTVQDWKTAIGSTPSRGVINAVVLSGLIDLNAVMLSKFSFADVTFKEKVLLSIGPHQLTDVAFIGCVFEKGFQFEGRLRTVSFNDCRFAHYVEQGKVLNISSFQVDDIKFKGDVFEANLHITNSKISNIEIVDCKGQVNRINIYYCDIRSCLIKDVKSGLSIYNRNLIDGNCCSIENLSLNLHPTFDSKMEFKDGSLETLNVTGTNLKGTILFNNLKVTKEIKICNLFNNSVFVIYTARLIGSELTLMESNLGKTEVNNVNFKEASVIRIEKCNLQELQYSNITWCDTINPVKKYSNIYFKEKREIYRQLKFAMSKQMDNISELHFYSLELKSYHNEIWRDSGRIGDKIILSFSLITNKFGTSWVIAAFWIFFVSLLFYFYIKSLMGIDMYSYQLNYDSSGQFMYEYLYSINPIRKLDESYGLSSASKIPGQIKLIDLLQRLSMSMLFYQFVVAFRKYFRK